MADTFDKDNFTQANDVNQRLSGELLKGEKILWSGQPEPTLFTGVDLFLVPFSLLWGGGMIFGFGAACFSESNKASLPIFFYFIFFFMALIGLYFIFGRFFYKLWKKQNTFYAITNQRVIVLNTVPSRFIQAAFINQIPMISQSIDSNGIGTITFGNSYPAMVYANTGLDLFVGLANSVPIFCDIKDVGKVYQLVNNARNQPNY